MTEIDKTREGRNGGKLLNTTKGGPSPNPKGKPKGTLSAKTIIRKWLESHEKIKNPLTNQDETVTILDSMTLALIAKARKGDVAAFNALLDRTEGKPIQGIENTGSNKLLLEIVRSSTTTPE